MIMQSEQATNSHDLVTAIGGRSMARYLPSMPPVDLMFLIPGALIALALLAGGVWAVYSVWNDQELDPPVRWMTLFLVILVLPISALVWLLARPALQRVRLSGTGQYR